MAKTPRSNAVWQAFAYAWQFGYVVLVPLILLGLGGRLLDRWLHTAPWLFLGGMLLAVVISLFGLIRKALQIFHDAEEGENAKLKMKKEK